MKYERPELKIEIFLMHDVICESLPGSIGGSESGSGNDDYIVSPDDEW